MPAGDELNRLALEGEFEGLAIGTDCGGGAHADQSLARRVGPMAHFPPAVQLAGAREIGADDDYRLSVTGTGYSVGERNGQRLCAEGRSDSS